ncbi:hypothetical protein GBAR_LOCUS15040, partial [Geodia barretti]
ERVNAVHTCGCGILFSQLTFAIRQIFNGPPEAESRVTHNAHPLCPLCFS